MNRLNLPMRVIGLALLVALIASAQAPNISFLAPGTVPSGTPTFTMSVFGSGFIPGDPPLFGAFVHWQRGSEPEVLLPAVWVSSSELIATVDASLVSTPGVVSVQVENRPLLVTPSFSNVVTFIISDGVAITTPSILPDGSQGVPYLTTLSAAGGSPPYLWARLEGQLPPGLTLDSSGTIAGTPTTAGRFSFDVGVIDVQQAGDSRLFTIEILDVPLAIVTESPLPPAEIGEFYTQPLEATGGAPPYRWVRTGGTLPPGLTLFGDGIINGRPTSTGLFTFDVMLTDQADEILTRQYELLVIGPLEIITASPLPDGAEGVSYSLALEAIGGVPDYLWSVAGGTLPPGLTLGSDGMIAGTPSAIGSFVFTAVVLDRQDTTVRKPFTLLIVADVAPLEITTPPLLPNATADDPYSTTLAAIGGEPPYTWFIDPIELPPGLTLSSTSAVLSGTPTEQGEYSLQAFVSDAAGESESKVFQLTVQRPQVVITTESPLPSGTAGQPYDQSFTATGGLPPYTWSHIGGTLPPGVTLSATGGLTGTPTSDGVFIFAVRANDSEGDFADKNFEVTFGKAALSITTDSILPPAAVGTQYSATMAATGGIPPYNWSRISGDLPPGVNLSAGGELSGTPTVPGDFNFRVRVADTAEDFSDKGFSILVTAPPLPGVSVDGLPDQTNPTDPQTLRVSISAPYPVDLTGTATLTFEPDATVPADDPAVQFSTGGRLVAFTIPAGLTTARFGAGDTVGIATGSVAGLITTETVIGSGDDAVRDSQQMTVQRTVPTISVTATRVAGGFEVRVTGFSSPRDMVNARFQFSAAAGSNLQTSDVTVPVSDVFSTWYQSAESVQFGSSFVYVQPFTIQGDTTAVTGVTVTLTNSVGNSEAATANF